MKKNQTESGSGGRRGNRNPYRRLGLVLSLSGAVLAPVFYFVAVSVPLTALALSAIILGLISAMLGNARPEITPEASQMMLQTGVENIAALLEELGLTARAIYLPSPDNGGRPKALIPLKEDGVLPDGKDIPDRLIARYGPNLESMCLVVTTPGSVSLDDMAVVRGGGPDQIENALNQILVGVMDLADSVSLHIQEQGLLVDVARPKLKYENIWYYRCLGSPLASVVATVASQALARAVRIKSETATGKNNTRIELEVLP